MTATYNPQAAADQARNAYRNVTAQLGLLALDTAILAMAHVAVSDPASAYNCGDRGVIYYIVRYSYPNSRASETASLTRSAAPLSFTGQRVTTALPI
jgi:hypothetical protein